MLARNLPSVSNLLNGHVVSLDEPRPVAQRDFDVLRCPREVRVVIRERRIARPGVVVIGWYVRGYDCVPLTGADCVRQWCLRWDVPRCRRDRNQIRRVFRPFGYRPSVDGDTRQTSLWRDGLSRCRHSGRCTPRAVEPARHPVRPHLPPYTATVDLGRFDGCERLPVEQPGGVVDDVGATLS